MVLLIVVDDWNRFVSEVSASPMDIFKKRRDRFVDVGTGVDGWCYFYRTCPV